MYTHEYHAYYQTLRNDDWHNIRQASKGDNKAEREHGAGKGTSRNLTRAHVERTTHSQTQFSM
jgi:hypothetical protein